MSFNKASDSNIISLFLLFQTPAMNQIRHYHKICMITFELRVFSTLKVIIRPTNTINYNVVPFAYTHTIIIIL